MTARYPAVTLLALSTGFGNISAPRSQSVPAYGFVESVRAVLLENLPMGFAGAFYHAVGQADELVVRLDDGRRLSIVQAEAPGVAPGQRVLVVAGKRGTRVEPASY